MRVFPQEDKELKNMIGMLFAALMAAGALIIYPLHAEAEESEAAAADITLTISDGSGADKLLDASYKTSITLDAGTEITVSSGEEMQGLYIIWDSLVPSWTLRAGGEEYTCGQNGYLHEYVELPEGVTEAVIVIPDGAAVGDYAGVIKGGMRIADIYGFTAGGSLPDWVQVWNPVSTQADILFFSTHGDDEHIFFGGIIPTYEAEQGLTVQVVYFTQHWTYSMNSKIREHEKLNGLWHAGNRTYPILGDFPDAYSETLKDALYSVDYDESVLFLTQCIRRCEPQVVVTHDLAGEYGHGQHILVAEASVDAIEYAADANYDSASAELYGTWDTPKFYIHLYDENPIRLDLRVPLTAFGGKTAVEVAQEAYELHESQQYTWFKVSDVNEGKWQYSNAEFGLYRSLVGPDVNCNDLMENLTSYAEQARIAEEERLAKEQAQEKLFAGIVAGVIILAALIIAAMAFLWNRKRKHR